MKIITMFCLVALSSVLTAGAENWYKYEYDGSTPPGESGKAWKTCSHQTKETGCSDGIFKHHVKEGKGWNHWLVRGPEFFIPENASGATVEYKVWAPATQNRGIRMQIVDPGRYIWVMYLKNDGGKQKLIIRHIDKGKSVEKIVELPNEFVTIRVVIQRTKTYDKASLYLNNDPKPVLKRWIGYGTGKVNKNAEFGFGAYNAKAESGTLLVDYIRWNPEKAVPPSPQAKKKRTPGRSIIKVPQVKKPPKVDGKLDDACYRNVKPVYLHIWRKGKKAKTVSSPKVWFKVCENGNKLYFAFDCHSSNSSNIPKQGARDTYYSGSDTIEIFLDPALSREKYYQIALNISNTLYDQFTKLSAWNGNITSAVKNNDSGWTAELALDMSSLCHTKIAPVWGTNFNYVDSGGGSLMTWVPVKNGHHEPENFGLLTFGGQAETKNLADKVKKLRKQIVEIKRRFSGKATPAMTQNLDRLQTKADLLISASQTSGSTGKILFLLKGISELNKEITDIEKSCDRELPLKNIRKLLQKHPWRVVPVNSVVKPGEKYCPSVNLPDKIKISGAKGEYESYQLIIYNGQEKITGGKLSLTPLTGKTAKIPASTMKVWRIDEVKLKAPTFNNPFVMPGDRVPDPLGHCDRNKIGIEKNGYKAFRITFKIPKDIPAGLYQGELTFRNNGISQRFPVELKVWNFSLPVVPNLKTSFAVWDKKGIDVFHNAPRGTAKNRKIHTLYKNTLLEYRITPREFPYDFSPDNLEAYGKWLDERRSRGATIVSVPFTDPPEKYLPALQAFLEKKGLLDITYTRSGDEPDPKHFPALIKRTEPWKKAAPKIKNLVAGNNGLNALGNIIGAWCPTTDAYSVSWAAEQRKKGKLVWWYVCNVPYLPYANFHTDLKGIEHRALFWQTFGKKADGILYWNTTNWRFGDPRKHPMGWPRTNGDGFLFYPGNDEPLPSLRLEILRDGVDDYDYLAILDKLLKENKNQIPPRLYSEAKNLLDLKSLCGDMRSFSRNPGEYLERREAIGNMIDKLQKYTSKKK